MKQSLFGVLFGLVSASAAADGDLPGTMSGFGFAYESTEESKVRSLYYEKSRALRSSYTTSGSMFKKMLRNLEVFYKISFSDVSLHIDQPDAYDFVSMEGSLGFAIQRPFYLFAEVGLNAFEVADHLLNKDSLDMTDYFYNVGLGIKQTRFALLGFAKYRNFEEPDLDEQAEWYYGANFTFYF